MSQEHEENEQRVKVGSEFAVSYFFDQQDLLLICV